MRSIICRLRFVLTKIFLFDSIKKYGISVKGIGLDLGILVVEYWLLWFLLVEIAHIIPFYLSVAISTFLGILTVKIIRIILILKKKKDKERREQSFHYPNDFIVK